MGLQPRAKMRVQDALAPTPTRWNMRAMQGVPHAEQSGSRPFAAGPGVLLWWILSDPNCGRTSRFERRASEPMLSGWAVPGPESSAGAPLPALSRVLVADGALQRLVGEHHRDAGRERNDREQEEERA